MSLSYTVGSRTRTKASGRNRRQKLPIIKPPGSKLPALPGTLNKSASKSMSHPHNNYQYHNQRTGRGRPVGYRPDEQMPPDNSPSSSRRNQQPAPGEAVYNPNGCYTGITPNQAKRNKLLSMASKEERSYKQYKERNRVRHVSITPSRVGGMNITAEEARLRQHKEMQQKKYERHLRQEELERKRREERERESAAIKDRGRMQAEKNKRKEQEQQREKQNSFNLHRRRTNEAFFGRLEQHKSSHPAAE